jgi:hypothetical protein
MDELTADEIHVLLDVIGGTAEPWTSYTTEPDEDPKVTKEGWAALLNSAQAKLTAKLSVL